MSVDERALLTASAVQRNIDTTRTGHGHAYEYAWPPDQMLFLSQSWHKVTSAHYPELCERSLETKSGS